MQKFAHLRHLLSPDSTLIRLLTIPVILLAGSPSGASADTEKKHTPIPASISDVRSLGAKGDGITFDTAVLQRVIDTCAGTGGTVLLPPGTYLTKPLELRGNMTLRLEKGAVLLGSPEIADYPVRLPEKFPVKTLCRSLLYAENADGLTISGEGVIDGNCAAMNIDGSVRMIGKEAFRPSLLRVFRSGHVTVKGVTFRDPAMWTTIFNECDNLLIEGVTVDAPTTHCANLSGFEISDCRNVIVRDCDVRSEDDGICFKTFPGGGGLRNVLVEGNKVACWHANGIKLGFWTYGPVSDIVIRNNKILYAKYAGLSLASVHGAVVRNITVEDLEMRNVGQPIFIRLGNRNPKEGRPVGSIDGITISRLRVRETNPENGPACVISGIPGARINNIRIKDSTIEMPGGLKGVPRLPPEKEDANPQSNMFWNTPAYAFFVRHADGVIFENVTVSRAAPDMRPWLSAVDAEVTTTGCRETDDLSGPSKITR